MPSRRIFVSATTRDLGSYRQLASVSLRKRGAEADDQAIFNLTYHQIDEMLKQRIAACDAVVCLLGFVYGGEPSGRPEGAPRRSYTQWEFFLARQLNKPVYLLLADELMPFDPYEPREPDELRQLQLAYRAEVTRDRDWRPFASKDQLRAELAELRFPWEGPPPEHQPNNLPFASLGTLFKGREAFLDDLRARLTVPDGRAAAIVARQAVHGLGGVGKTRAALEYAWRHAGDYTALLFVSAPSPGELRANLATLAGVLAVDAVAAGTAVDEQMAKVLAWLDAHPGWLLILDNVDTDEAAREVEDLLARLRSGHVLITSRIADWSAAVEPLELHVLAPADAVAFLLARTRNRLRKPDDDATAAVIARALDGLALALEQAGAYVERLRLSFAEYLNRWHTKRPEVLQWHDQRLMKYPASVAVTWETTFAQLNEAERRLLGVLSWLAPEPIPLSLLDAGPLAEVIPDARAALAGLAGYSLARFEAGGHAVLVHRLVQEITRGRSEGTERTERVKIALDSVAALAPLDADDVRTWPVWMPLAPHAAVVVSHADSYGLVAGVAAMMSQLGQVLHSHSQFRVAETFMRRALEIDERAFGPDHPNVAIGLNNLAQLLQKTNRMGEAEPFMRRALDIDERVFGHDHPNVARHLNNLAHLLQATNRLGEAEPFMRRALEIDERAFAPDHPIIAIPLNNLAMLLYATNRLGEAEPFMRRALEIDEQAFGLDHPNVAVRLNNLAQLLQATSRMGEAEPFMRRALEIDEQAFGLDHPNVAVRLNNLASLLYETNRQGEAEPFMRRALEIDERSFGPDHPNVARDLINLASLLQDMNRMGDEAEPFMRRALEIDERSFGPDHPEVATDLSNLAHLLKATNRMGEAEPLMRRALEIDERSFGLDHANIAVRLNNLASLLQDTNRMSEAEPLMRRGLGILRCFLETTGHEHPRWRVGVEYYLNLLEAMDLPDEEVARRLGEVTGE